MVEGSEDVVGAEHQAVPGAEDEPVVVPHTSTRLDLAIALYGPGEREQTDWIKVYRAPCSFRLDILQDGTLRMTTDDHGASFRHI